VLATVQSFRYVKVQDVLYLIEILLKITQNELKRIINNILIFFKSVLLHASITSYCLFYIIISNACEMANFLENS